MQKKRMGEKKKKRNRGWDRPEARGVTCNSPKGKGHLLLHDNSAGEKESEGG